LPLESGLWSQRICRHVHAARTTVLISGVALPPNVCTQPTTHRHRPRHKHTHRNRHRHLVSQRQSRSSCTVSLGQRMSPCRWNGWFGLDLQLRLAANGREASSKIRSQLEHHLQLDVRAVFLSRVVLHLTPWLSAGGVKINVAPHFTTTF